MADNATAAALRTEWESIRAERDELMRKTELLRGTHDGAALHAHSAALARHHERVHEFEQQLQAYHDAHGPLGKMTE